MADTHFDRWLQMAKASSTEGFTQATCEVVDTAWGILRWFEDHPQLKPTAADVVAMTKLVMEQRERNLRQTGDV